MHAVRADTLRREQGSRGSGDAGLRGRRRRAGCAVYPLQPDLAPTAGSFLPHVLGQLAFYIGWEALFRGVLLFGLSRRFGFAGANLIQTALSVIAHFGRPLPEALVAIPAGLAFGGVARQTRSIWPVVLIHLAAGAAQDWFIIR